MAWMRLQRQMAQAARRAPASPADMISDVDLRQLKTQAAQGKASAQNSSGSGMTAGGACRRTMRRHGMVRESRRPGPCMGAEPARQLYADGRGVPQDYKKADSGGSKRQSKVFRRRSTILGSCMPTGGVCHRTIATARGWYEKSRCPGQCVGAGPARAAVCRRRVCHRTMRRHGDGTRKPLPRATRGRRLSWRCCSQRAGGPQDYVPAQQWWEKGALQGNPPAQVHLGLAV